MPPIVLAFTGASGALYGVRLLDVLLNRGQDVHLTMSPAAVEVLKTELQVRVDLQSFDPGPLQPVWSRWAALEQSDRPGETGEQTRGRLTYCHYQDWNAGIASGSFLTAGMVICPCSMGTLASVAHGLSSNLIHRAADVHLKERRKLILVPRETPLGSIPLGNMKTLSDAGAVVLPAMPGFYDQPQRIEDLVDFIVSRICDQLQLSGRLAPRWGEGSDKA